MGSVIHTVRLKEEARWLLKGLVVLKLRKPVLKEAKSFLYLLLHLLSRHLQGRTWRKKKAIFEDLRAIKGLGLLAMENFWQLLLRCVNVLQQNLFARYHEYRTYPSTRLLQVRVRHAEGFELVSRFASRVFPIRNDGPCGLSLLPF